MPEGCWLDQAKKTNHTHRYHSNEAVYPTPPPLRKYPPSKATKKPETHAPRLNTPPNLPHHSSPLRQSIPDRSMCLFQPKQNSTYTKIRPAPYTEAFIHCHLILIDLQLAFFVNTDAEKLKVSFNQNFFCFLEEYLTSFPRVVPIALLGNNKEMTEKNNTFSLLDLNGNLHSVKKEIVFTIFERVVSNQCALMNFSFDPRTPLIAYPAPQKGPGGIDTLALATYFHTFPEEATILSVHFPAWPTKENPLDFYLHSTAPRPSFSQQKFRA